MMKYKRTASLFIILSMLLAAASCGQDETPSDTIETETQTGTETVAQTVKSEYIKPEVDYGGKTITIASYSYEGAWNILKYNILLNEENGDIINDAIVDRNRQVETDLNIKFELLPLTGDDRGNSTKLQKLILAGEDTFAFAMQMNAGLSSMLTTSGMLVDLKSIPTLDLSHSWWNQYANDEYTIYDKQFAAVGDICFFNIGAPIVNYFSKQLVEDNNLDNPYELVYSGKWTVDRMLKMATDISNDLNGNQQVDKEDQFGFAAEVDSLAYFIMGAGIRLSEHTSDGDIEIKVNNEKTVNICEKLINVFYNKDVMLLASTYHSSFTNVHSDFFMPKLMNNELLFYSNQLLVSLNLRNMDSDFGILPLPKYDETQEDYASFANTWFSDHLIVPATNTDLEMTGNIIESMGYYSQQLIIPAFIDKTVMSKSIRDEDSAKMIDLIRSSQTFDVAFIFDWGKIKSNFSSMASGNNPAFATSYATIENNVKAALETTLGELKG